MCDACRGFGSAAGRLLLAIIFLMSGFGKLGDPAGTVQYMQSRGMPLAGVGVWVAIVAELIGAALLMVGLKARWGAGVLILFLIGATLYFHNFWTYPADQVRMQTIQFFKNLAIMGGLLMVIAHGAGPWSIDARLARRRAVPQTNTQTQTHGGEPV